MPTITPSEFLKDYKDNFKRMGHDQAFQVLRSRITFSFRYGHAWFMDHKKQIEKEIKKLEETWELSEVQDA